MDPSTFRSWLWRMTQDFDTLSGLQRTLTLYHLMKRKTVPYHSLLARTYHCVRENPGLTLPDSDGGTDGKSYLSSWIQRLWVRQCYVSKTLTLNDIHSSVENESCCPLPVSISNITFMKKVMSSQSLSTSKQIITVLACGPKAQTTDTMHK